MLRPVRLKELREGQALTQDELAKKAGVVRGTITNIEGGAGAYPPTVRKLAAALGVEPAALLAAPKGEG